MLGLAQHLVNIHVPGLVFNGNYLYAQFVRSINIYIHFILLETTPLLAVLHPF